MTDLIIGAGGGRSAGGSQKVEKDNLDSRQTARIVDLISEGEIEGLATPARLGLTRGTERYSREMLKDVYFNNTPIVRENADVSTELQGADQNFQDYKVSLRFGADHGVQGSLKEVSESAQEEFVVGTTVANGSPVTRTITDTNVTAVRITLNFPQLQRFKSNGDIVGTSVEYEVYLSYNGGAFQRVVFDTVAGRSVDLYQRMKYIEFDRTQSKPIEVRVIRLTDNDDDRGGDDSFNSEMIWSTYTEHVYGKFTYPHSALVGHEIDARQFGQIPQRTYRVRGIKVKIPRILDENNNNLVQVDSDNGRIIYPDNAVWDGVLGAAVWTTDPAWILYDLLTSKRYGFGAHFVYKDITGTEKTRLNVFNFYACSQYCSALVPDGFGGQEPRFSCNLSIQKQSEAFDLINQMASIFRAQPYWSSGEFALTMDRPQDPELIFTQSNVTEAGFSYSGSSVKTRHTCVQVSYLDLDLRDTAYELVEDEEAIKKFGVVKKSIKAVGCTSRGQARRLGEWLLYSENRETEVCSFTTRLAEGIKARPGMIIKISDPFRANRFRGGRIKPGSTEQILKLDRTKAQMFPNGAPDTFDFNVMSRVWDDEAKQMVVRQVSIGDINSAQLSGDTLTLPTALEHEPVVNSVFAIGISSLRPSLWRVISVSEEDQLTYSISALAYEPGKYDHIERDVPLEPRDVTALDNPASAPTNLDAREVLYQDNGQIYNKIILSWQRGADTSRTLVTWRYENGTPNTFTTQGNDYEILNAAAGDYEFIVRGQSGALLNSTEAKLAFTATGKTAPPATIAALSIAPIDQHNAELHWPQATDLDSRIGGTVRIRHTPETGAAATWNSTNDVVPAVNGNSTRKIVPLLDGTYFIRAVDSTGNQSPGVASVVVNLPAPQDLLPVQTYREDDDTPPFQGAATNMAYSQGENALVLTATGLIDTIASWDDDVSDLDFYGDVATSGSYQFANTLDLGAKFDLELLQILKSRSGSFDDLWGNRTGNIDTWADIDGDTGNISDVNAELYVRATNDDPGSGPTYGEWQPFKNGTQRGRGFQFKVEATTGDPSQSIAIEQLGVTTKLQRRTEEEHSVTSGAAAKTITFPAAFYATPSVSVTAQDMGSGDYFQVSSVSRTGFTVTFKNSSDTIVSKTFDYQAVGHGREIT